MGRFGLPTVLVLLGACGGAPARGHLREADRGERVAVLQVLGASVTLVDARAVGEGARVVAVFTRPAPSPVPAACGAGLVPVVAASAECESVVLARFSPALDAVDALTVIGVACRTDDAPALRIAQLDAGDLDDDGRVELAIEFDARLVPASDPRRVVVVVDVETMAIELATDVSILEGDHPGRVYGFHPDEGPHAGLQVADFEIAQPVDGELGHACMSLAYSLQVGVQRERFDFEDVDPGLVTVWPYDAARDCWPDAR